MNGDQSEISSEAVGRNAEMEKVDIIPEKSALEEDIVRAFEIEKESEKRL